jgi:hypothetical protein
VSRLLRTLPWLVLLGVVMIGCQSSSEPMATSPDDYVLTVNGMV